MFSWLVDIFSPFFVQLLLEVERLEGARRAQQQACAVEVARVREELQALKSAQERVGTTTLG